MLQQSAFKMTYLKLWTAVSILKTNDNVLDVLCTIMKMYLHAQFESGLHHISNQSDPPKEPLRI